jgi:hypothetical protein
VDRVVVVVLLDVVAAETFDVEECAVEELELLAGMVSTLGETCGVLVGSYMEM